MNALVIDNNDRAKLQKYAKFSTFFPSYNLSILLSLNKYDNYRSIYQF